MQSIEREGLFAGWPRAYPSCAGDRKTAVSWFARAQRNAERANRIGFLFAVLFCLGAAAYGLSLSARTPAGITEAADIANRAALSAGFHIDTLAIRGAKNAPKDALMSALKLPSQTSILFYDTAAAREALLRLGWVEAADVRRTLPSGLDVTVKERVPFARFATGGKIQIVGRDGRVLAEDEPEKFSGLPLVEGEGAPEEAAALEEALQGHDALIAKIERAEFVAERFWTLRLKDGLAVKLPRKVGALSLRRLDILLASAKVSEMGLDTIDLRLPHRTVLQLHNAGVAERDKAAALLTGWIRPMPPGVPPKGKAF